jgi:hypothetical protein
MIEPFLSRWRDGRIDNDLPPDAVIESITIASGLGRRTACTWLKLPVVDDMERVLASSTLPALLLGGEVTDPEPPSPHIGGSPFQGPEGIRFHTRAKVVTSRRPRPGQQLAAGSDFPTSN